MMYPFMVLDNKTEVVHSDPYDVDGIETIKFYFEQPVFGGFHSAECYLPSYEWKNVDGFSQEELAKYEDFLKSVVFDILK